MSLCGTYLTQSMGFIGTEATNQRMKMAAGQTPRTLSLIPYPARKHRLTSAHASPNLGTLLLGAACGVAGESSPHLIVQRMLNVTERCRFDWMGMSVRKGAWRYSVWSVRMPPRPP